MAHAINFFLNEKDTSLEASFQFNERKLQGGYTNLYILKYKTPN